jgi:hypothetical protein
VNNAKKEELVCLKNYFIGLLEHVRREKNNVSPHCPAKK